MLKHAVLVALLLLWPVFGNLLLASTGAALVKEPANQSLPMEPPDAAPRAFAVRTDSPPQLDGEVLTDPVWLEVPAIAAFWQQTPDEGKAASERTEVRFLYTPETLFVGVVCFDRNPNLIVISDSRRDAPLEDTDSFQIILDTYLDRQNGFVFGTNPAGIVYDGQVSREGQGSGRLRGSMETGGQTQTGSGGGFNLNWDAPWEVRTQLSEIGWQAEFAIPFKTLRFPGRANQTWGMNLQRNIRRRSETSFWAPLTRQYSLYRLSEAGTLEDLQIQAPGNLKLIPYLLGETRREDTVPVTTNWLGDWGVDLKYSVTPSLTLDATYNTDFAQVEVDELQINLDRFNLFFPEKRPFFLENAGLFSVGSPSEVELFFSRRIGIGRQGEVVPILFGARLTGKLARTNVGFLNMQTGEANGVSASNNYSVARVSRELPNRSALGAIFVNRQGTGELASSGDHNRTYAVDGRWGFGEYGQVSGYLAGTSTPGRSEGQHAYRLGIRRNSPGLDLEANYTEVGEDFNPEVGFLRRTGGYRTIELRAHSRYRPTDWGTLLELRPHATYEGFWDLQGFQQSGLMHLDNHWQWRAGHELDTGLNFTREGVVESFEIFPGVVVPPGTYDHAEARLEAFTNRGAWISAGVGSRMGGFFGGDRINLVPSVRVRWGETFNSEFALDRNDIDLPGGSFSTNLARARLSYSFSPRVAVQSLIQFNDRADIWTVNLRFSWLQSGNNGLFIVYNDTRGLGDLANPSILPNRSLIIKYSHLFDLLR